MTSTASSTTVLLVHGAFADASSWSRVVGRLSAAGVTAIAAPNPLRGLTADGEYIASLVSQIEDPVLLVGHSQTPWDDFHAAYFARQCTTRPGTSTSTASSYPCDTGGFTYATRAARVPESTTLGIDIEDAQFA
ncbi:MAG: hypothetical protein QOF84_752 [Streptomyces sp.]|jgi:pimeloyl-ACP methyl ester carboxylesterase|nr:hypothetical protein [Streptomyces sp.]